MPNYDYRCHMCDYTFEKQLLIADRNKPTKEPCPKCGEKAVQKLFGAPGVDKDTFVSIITTMRPGRDKCSPHRVE